MALRLVFIVVFISSRALLLTGAALHFSNSGVVTIHYNIPVVQAGDIFLRNPVDRRPRWITHSQTPRANLQMLQKIWRRIINLKKTGKT